MHPHQEEYRKIKERARAAKKNSALRRDVTREIARFVVTELRTLGLSEGALCAWASLEGYESYSVELAPFQELKHYKDIHESMWALARHAGIAHESGWMSVNALSWKISSEPLRLANRSVVWTTTKEFRCAVEAERKKATPKKSEVIFYEPQPLERTSLDVKRWV